MLTPQERQIVEYGRKQGKPLEESLKAISKYRLATKKTEAEKPGFFSDLGGDIKGIFTGTKDVITKRGEQQREILEAEGRGEQGKASSIFQTAANLAMAPLDVFGQVVKGGVKAVLPQEAENNIKELISSAAGKVLSLPQSQKLVENYEALKKYNPEKARNVRALAETGEFLLTFAGLKGGKDLVTAGTEGTKQGFKFLGTTIPKAKQGVKNVVQPFKQGATKLFETTKKATAPYVEEAKRIPSRISTNYATTQAAEEGIKKLPSQVAQTAVRDGVDIGDVRTIINSAKPGNKIILKQLSKAAKDFSAGTSKTNPIEIVGKPIVTGLKNIEKVRGTVGQKLGKVAENLGKVTKQEADDAVFNELKKVPGLAGLKKTLFGELDFRGTTLATGLSKADRMAIRKIFYEATRAGTGRSKHLLRQELFEILGGQKRSLSAITQTQEKAFEAVRRGLSNLLGSRNTQYKTLSLEYAKLMRPLQDLRKLMKAVGGETDDDILNMSAGLLARRLTSHAASNPQIRAILRAIDRVTKLSGKTEASTELLQDFYNILNRYYDIAGKTTFESLTKSGVEKATGIGQFVVGKAREFAGETVAVRQRAIEKLLEELLR